jgi:ADP-ribose pyrophosphatase YjhB (NUDIX family)
MESLSHNLAGGIVVIEDDKVLLVNDSYGWTLPRGSTEVGESFLETSRREGIEETGFEIDVHEVAFVTEYKTQEYGQYLQVFYSASIISDNAEPPNEDEISEIKFVSINELRKYLKSRPLVIPLENWIKERVLKYHFFDLDVEGFDI